MSTALLAPPTLVLRDYQREALAAIAAAEHRGVRRALVALPTGCGKTIVFAALSQQRSGRTLVLAHRDELLRQARDKLLMVDPSADIGIVKADEDQLDAQIVVASIQTLAVPARLARLGRDFATVIIDEAHHAAAPTYRRVLDHLGIGAANNPLLVGFTATPERADRIGLDCVFQEIVFQRGILAMIGAGYLADLRAVQIRLRADFGQLHVRGGDYVEQELEATLLASNAPALAVQAYRDHAMDRKAILFAPTVALARTMAQTFQAAGIRAAAVDGATSLPERRELLARFGQGELQVITNCGVLTEGFDEPSVDCIIMARPTRSRPLYVQMIGRGTRPYPDKADCLVLDLVGATTNHELVTTASLFGLPPTALDQRTVSDAVQVQRVAEQRRAVAAGQLEAVSVDLFQRRRLHWTRAGRCWSLSAGDGLIVLEPADGGWAVFEQRRGHHVRALATGLPLDYAQGVAEDRARSLGAAKLLDRDAPWRGRPASEKQLAVLYRRRQRVRPGLTAGDASDLIAASMMKRLA